MVLSVTVSTKCLATKVRPVFTSAESTEIKGADSIFGSVEKGSGFKSVTISLPDEYSGIKVRLQINETPYTEWKQVNIPATPSTGGPIQQPMPPPPIVGPPPVEPPPAVGNL